MEYPDTLTARVDRAMKQRAKVEQALDGLEKDIQELWMKIVKVGEQYPELEQYNYIELAGSAIYMSDTMKAIRTLRASET